MHEPQFSFLRVAVDVCAQKSKKNLFQGRQQLLRGIGTNVYIIDVRIHVRHTRENRLYELLKLHWTVGRAKRKRHKSKIAKDGCEGKFPAIVRMDSQLMKRLRQVNLCKVLLTTQIL